MEVVEMTNSGTESKNDNPVDNNAEDPEKTNGDVNMVSCGESEENKQSTEDETSENVVDRTTESPTTGDNNTNFSTAKCVYCGQILSANDEPKLLECLHSACGACVKVKIEEQKRTDEENSNSKGYLVITCAACRIVCRKSLIIDNQFLLELNEDNTNVNENLKTEEQKCKSCDDNETATSWCVECAEFICNQCVQAHKRLKITKDHTIKSKEEAAQDNPNNSTSGCKNLICPVHHNEQLTLFCENCDVLTCRDCQLNDHRDHKYKFTHEIASETKKFITGMLKDVSYKRVLLDSAMKVIDDRQTLITDKKQTLVKEITQMVVKLTNTINVRGKELVHRLNEVCDNKQKTLNEKKVALEQLSQLTDHCIEFVTTALEKGSDNAILFSKRHVTSHLQRIKCRRADIPNPEIPVRIHLALDKVPDLIKVLSSIGAIVVDGKVYPPVAPASTSVGATTPSTSPIQRSNHNASPLIFPRMPPPYPQQPVQQQPQVQQQQAQQQHQQQQHQQQQHQQQQQQHQQQQHQQQQHQQQQHQQQQHQQQQHQQQHQQHHQQQQQQLQQQQAAPQQAQPQQHQSQQHQVQQPQMLPSQQHQYASQQMAQNAHLQSRSSMQRGPANMIRHPSGIVRLPGGSHQQVSSSTHPQASMNISGDRMNPQLRGLLQNNGQAVYIQTSPGVYQAVQPSYLNPQYNQQRFPHQSQMNNYHPQNQNRMGSPSGSQILQSRPMMQQRPGVPQLMSPQYQAQMAQNIAQNQQQLGAKWHTPMENFQGGIMGANRPPPALIAPDDSFKITLKPRTSAENKSLPPAVTSTIPKTPSPSLGKGDETERNLDKFCEDSVKDLMATIAKLDSNGVQVLAEGRSKTGGSPHVDSSTDESPNATKTSQKSQIGDTDKDDPNEDWCAVCMDGGELVCCDKCPKVFHQNCHIPPLSVEESDTWQCLLCMNFADIPDNALGERRDIGLSPREKKIAERIVLELYCQYEPSLHFRELVGQDNTYYYSVIKKPVSLEMIKQKVNWNSDEHYTSVEQLIRDIRQLFRNAYLYNPENSTVYKDAKTLEAFFDQQLEKWLPAYAYENFCDDEDDILPSNKKYRRIISD